MNGRLLILSLYYAPDLSACAFRTAALVDALRTLAPDLLIDVITTVPNRYQSFRCAAPELEHGGGVTVRRLSIPLHRNTMASQASAYAQFARRAARIAAGHRYDLVFATSSRLMTAALGAWISRQSGAPLYLDIRDLFVDTMNDIMSPRVTPALGPVLSAVEKWTIKRARKVNLVSPGFESYFQQRYPRLPLSFFTNGIDDEFLVPVESIARTEGVRPITVVYAGNMGEGQGLQAIVPALAAQLAGRVRFRLIGDGGRRAHLVEALRRAGVTTVELLPPMPRKALFAEYQSADVLFLHLNNHEAFTRVLPSKVFEYAAMGKPIWAGVGGYAAEFLRREVTNAAVFTPCDAAAGVRAFESLDLCSSPRDAFVRAYARRGIMQRLASDIIAQLPSGGAV